MILFFLREKLSRGEKGRGECRERQVQASAGKHIYREQKWKTDTMQEYKALP